MRGPRTIVAVLLLALGLACLESGTFEPFPCNDFDECPGDLVCLDGLCRTTWPQGVFGDVCSGADDCEAPYSQCLIKTHSVTGLCTKACGNRWDCPKGARCIPFDAGSVCMPACEKPSDCDETLFCRYRTVYGGNSYCYPLGPPDGAGLLELCDSRPCRDELVCLTEHESQIPYCMHLCHPGDFQMRNAPTCEYRGMNGACDWVVFDPDATRFLEVGAACSPRCDTTSARNACMAAGWSCYPPGVDDSLCWPREL